MAFTQTPRLALPQWSDDLLDSPTRAQFTAAFLALEQGAAMYAQGTRAARPAAGKAGRYYFATDESLVYVDNGTAWTVVGASSRLTGEIIMYAPADAPAGWLRCDGAAVSRTAYAALFTALGTVYGTGNGSTTFNVPNFGGRSPVGTGPATGTGDTDAYDAGQTGGRATVVLTTAMMPEHAHTAAAATNTHDHLITVASSSHTHAAVSVANGHSHTTKDTTLTSGTYNVGEIRTYPFVQESETVTVNPTSHAHTATAGNSTHAHVISIGSTGSGQAHENRMPYIVVPFIIKT